MDFDLLTVFWRICRPCPWQTGAHSHRRERRTDSMALLHLFVRWNVRNIGVPSQPRLPGNCRPDAAFVRDYCRDLHIPVEIQEYDINRYLQPAGIKAAGRP